MRQSGLSRPAGVLAGLFVFVPSVLLAQRALSREGDQWVETLTGTAPAAARLRVNCHGPVHLEGGAASEIAYSI